MINLRLNILYVSCGFIVFTELPSYRGVSLLANLLVHVNQYLLLKTVTDRLSSVVGVCFAPQVLFLPFSDEVYIQLSTFTNIASLLELETTTIYSSQLTKYYIMEEA